ncbi:transglycosylase domain-containing protein [Georgenia sp. Z1491]|uniref:transglycosylase domain-containing protein n=1 Tax=Georgenia sp. Z1491 TaxID=3416707 RepID=UPI003CFBBEC6
MAKDSTGTGTTDPGTKGRVPLWRRLLFWMVGLFVAGVAGAAGLFVAAYASIDVPAPDDFALAEGTTVYFADGETVMGRFAEYDRSSISLDDVPDHVSQAVIASEDRRFYENPGVDWRGIARALWNNVQGEARQGGSSLTQQYVERYYTGTTTSYVGKFRETILALRIDQEQSKDEILENYMNTIYFGRGTYGVQEASMAYFGHGASEMTLSESALLAGIIPSPSAWDPGVDPERAEQRFERVLDLMLEDGWITAEERADAEFPEVIEPEENETYAGPNGYLLAMVRDEVVAQGDLTLEEIDTGGYDIVTTIDQRSQQAAVDAVGNLPEDRPENNNVGLVSLRPESGAIVALYGGPDYVTDARNNATQDRAQAGSTAKPFTLVAAIEDGVSMAERFPSYTPMEIEGYDVPVNNYDQHNRGPITLREATAQSVNTTYALVNQQVGPETMVDVATRAGWSEETPGLVASASNVLGPASPTVLDSAQAYNTFASRGVRHEPYIVEEVLDRDDNRIYTGGDEGVRAFEEAVIDEATYAMEAVLEPGGTGATAGEIGRPAAGKTGSSNAYRSAWFAGWVPQLTTVVSMYQVGEDGTEEELTGFGGVDLVAGGTFPAEIWRDYMQVATEGMPVVELPERPDPEDLPGSPDRQTQIPTQAPVPTEEPTTEEETTEEETTEEETTEEETTEEETTEEETTPEPTEEPTTEDPTTPDPTEEPTTEAPPSTPPPGQGGQGGGNGGPGQGGAGNGRGPGQGDGG